MNVSAKIIKKQCEKEAVKLFDGIIHEGVKVVNEEKVNEKQPVNKVNLEYIIQQDMKALIDQFNDKKGVLRAERKQTTQNVTSLEPIIWGQSIRPNFPVTSYMESFIDHKAFDKHESLPHISTLQEQSQNSDEVSEVSYHSKPYSNEEEDQNKEV